MSNAPFRDFPTHEEDRRAIETIALNDPRLLMRGPETRPESLQNMIERECFERAADIYFNNMRRATKRART